MANPLALRRAMEAVTEANNKKKADEAATTADGEGGGDEEHQEQPPVRTIARSNSSFGDVAKAVVMAKKSMGRTRDAILAARSQMDQDKTCNLPHDVIHDLYVARCQDSEEVSSKDGLRAFRDQVEPICRGNSLSLRSLRVGNSVCSVLLRTLRQSERIVNVDLYRNFVRDDGMTYIIELIHVNPHVRTLNVGCNGITGPGGVSLAEELEINETLQQLELGTEEESVFRMKNRLDNEAIVRLAEALRVNDSLWYLGLDRNYVVPTDRPKRYEIDESAAYYALAETLKQNDTLEVLRLAGTGLGTVSGVVLLESLHENTALHHLDLSSNSLGPEAGKGVGYLFRKNSTLAVLHLSGNPFGQYGGACLVEGLRSNYSLVHLSLADVSLCDYGTVHLADSLAQNCTLTSLDISNNKITEVGGVALASMLTENQVLSTLKVSDNTLGDTTAAAMANSLVKNVSLVVLELGRCQIGDRGAASLATALQFNTTLQSLKLFDNYVGEEGGRTLVQLLQANSSLRHIGVDGNQVAHSETIHLKHLCDRNVRAAKTAMATPLKREIVRLTMLQQELVDVKAAIGRVADYIADAEQELRTHQGAVELIEEDEFVVTEKNRKQLVLFETSMKDATARMNVQEEEIAAVEAEYGAKLGEVEAQLEVAGESRKELAAQLEGMSTRTANPDQEHKDRAVELERRIAESKAQKEELLEEADRLRVEADAIKTRVFALQQSQRERDEAAKPEGEVGGGRKKKKKGKSKGVSPAPSPAP